MATIYDVNGEYITQGLQGSATCDEAVIAARRIALDRDEDVILEDDGEFFVVSPDGDVRATIASAIGFGCEEEK